MSYDVVCPNSKTGDLARLELLVATADERLPDWVEIRMGKSGECWAYNTTPKQNHKHWYSPEWHLIANVRSRPLGKGKKRWGWKTFCITKRLAEEVTATSNATTE
jgi:hypothetical protein